MCRLYGFSANAPTKVECSLVLAQNALLIQSRSDARGLSHADGWGIAYYKNGEPTVERRDRAAYHDVDFSFTAERVYARRVIAHVRRATVGQPSSENTHPFRYGRWIFAHNGTVTGFGAIRPFLEEETEEFLLHHRLGTTDSELTFLWILTRMMDTGIDLQDRCSHLGRLGTLLRDSIQELDDRCRRADPSATPRLNFLLTDGMILVASRWNNSLYWLVREGVHDCEICGIPHVDTGPSTDYRATVVASEPISHEDWKEMPNRSLLIADQDLRTRIQK